MRILLGFIFCLLTTSVVQAQDDGLYAPKAPEGSAFIRFVNIGSDAVKITAHKKDYGDVGSMQASPYYVVPQGDVKFSVNNIEGQQAVVAGNYYTVVDHASVIQDKANTDRTKATLAFYNLTEGDVLTLKAKNGTVAVLDNVSAGNSTARNINPVKIDLSVHKDGIDVMAVEPFIMERGNHYSVFYNGKDAFVVTATVDTTR